MSAREYVEKNDLQGAIERFRNTTARWRKYWFEICFEIFNQSKEWAKKFIFDPIAQTILTKAKKSKYDEKIENNGIDINGKYGEQVYLFRFYNSNNELVCSKVGTTTRTIKKRLIEELNSKTYKQLDCTHAVVDRVYYCSDLPAEGLKSLIRSVYIRQYPKLFKKNDRFIQTEFDLNLCDKVANDYLKGA